MRLPAAGIRSEVTWQVEPFDEAVAVAGLLRAGNIARLVDLVGGRVAAASLPATEHHCLHCDWYDPKAKDVRLGCPGVGTLALPPKAPDPAVLFGRAVGV
jgi:hypothetical protein